MGFYGADTQQLRDLAKTLNKEADRLDLEVVKVVSWTLFSSPWDGVDAIEFRARWTRQIVPVLGAASQSLRAAASDISRNADDQEKASDPSSDSINGVGSTQSRTDDGGKKSSITGTRGGKLGHDRDMLDLAFASYYRGKDGHESVLPAGWEEVSSAELKKLGINPAQFGKTGDSFNATLYRSDDGRYALAFEGTEFHDIRDIANDIAGAVATSDQVVAAMNAATKVKERLEVAGVDADQLTMTGHSLGGELAAVASEASGCKGVTFNAAGVSSVSRALAGARHAMSTKNVLDTYADFSNVTSYTSVVDPLSILQDASGLPNSDASGLPNSVGKRVFLDAPEGTNIWDVGANHMDAPLKKAMDKMAEESGGYQ